MFQNKAKILLKSLRNMSINNLTGSGALSTARRITMSVAGITRGIAGYSSQTILQQLQQQLQKLGQDINSGSLSAAQPDFATLQGDLAQGSSSAGSSQSSNPVAQAFNQLSSDLQSGNLSAAQKDFSTLQSDYGTQALQQSTSSQSAQPEGHHHHHQGGDSDSTNTSSLSQLVSQLGQALQSGNLSTAKQTYAALQTDLQSFSQYGQQLASTGASGTSSFSFSI